MFRVITLCTVVTHRGDAVFCRCGKCRHYMKFVQAKPSRLHCASCDDTYTLPQNGNIKLYKELRCPLDHFELVLWTTGAQGKVSVLSSGLSLLVGSTEIWLRVLRQRLFLHPLSSYPITSFLVNVYSVRPRSSYSSSSSWWFRGLRL